MNTAIRKITETLLLNPSDNGAVYNAVHELHGLFSTIAGVTAGDINDEDIYLSSGKAVSSTKAAHCLLEYQRTAVFLRGVYKAILQLKSDFPNERLRILYAGCGPYATLLTPLTTFFTADELAFHLLDINSTSLGAAKKIYNNFGLNEYVEEWICADASVYQVPPGQTVHLIISETMQNALRKEPQVEIMLNLIPQLPAKGQFVPQEIVVSVKLMSPRLETERLLVPGKEFEGIDLGTIYSIGSDNCTTHEAVTITVPGDVGIFKQGSLLTDITTFGDERLEMYACSLNMPLNLFNADEHLGQQLRIKYQMGKVPGFECQWLD
ncbi:MAG: hypothetical protein JWR12_2210 [Mucilaginibacter sp.]|nr:hypothetical protein [Mucilaginibacter sp.]